MTAVTAKPNTINWLATILSKAQGVFTAIGGSVDIGLECANIRREYDRLKAENERLRAALKAIADSGRGVGGAVVLTAQALQQQALTAFDKAGEKP